MISSINKKVINAGIVNYLFGFLQVYWIFILTSIGIKNLGITVIISMASGSLLLLSIFYGKFRNKFGPIKIPYKGVWIISLIETIILIIFSLSLWSGIQFITIFFFLFECIINQLKVLELKYNYMVQAEVHNNKLDNFFLKHQISVELGWGVGTLLAGFVSTQLKSLNMLSSNQVMALVVSISIVLNIVYSIIVFVLSKKSPVIENPIVEDLNEKWKIKDILREKSFMIALLIIFILTLLFYGEDTVSSYRLSITSTNSEQMFGVLTCLASIIGLFVLKITDLILTKSKNEKQTTLTLLKTATLGMVVGYGVLMFTNLSLFELIIYSILLSGVSFFYGIITPFVSSYNNSLNKHEVVAVSDFVVAFSSIFSSFVIFYPLSELKYGYISILTLGLIAFILFFLIKNKKSND